jgi:hypothetical protein
MWREILIADSDHGKTLVLSDQEIRERLSGAFPEEMIGSFLKILLKGGLAGAKYSDPEWKKTKIARPAALKPLRLVTKSPSAEQKKAPKARLTPTVLTELPPIALVAPEKAPKTFGEVLKLEIEKALKREAMKDDVVHVIGNDEINFQEAPGKSWQIVKNLTSAHKNKGASIIKLTRHVISWEAFLVPEENGRELLKKLLREESLIGLIFTRVLNHRL